LRRYQMNQMGETKTIDIRPDVGVYATYRRLSYRPWNAIAEFVDNSTQNYYDHKVELQKAYEKEDGPKNLRIEITYDNETNALTILDNANGMNWEELQRAVMLNRPPPNRTGRCEYGMGLKTAACWFGKIWTIETCRLGEGIEYHVKVDVPKLTESHSDKIDVVELPADPSSHFTKIKILDLYNRIRGGTPNRIKEQLGSMYREDLRSKEVEIIWNYQQIDFEEPTFLEEDIGDHVNVWKKNISFDVPWENEGKALRVYGWIGIRIPGRQRDAGFVLIRRGRVIVGGPDEGYKPTQLFGQGNTFRSQRLIGELHLDDWPISQAKDAFDWYGGLEDALIEALRRECSEYMEKAEVYREQKNKPFTNGEVKLITERTQQIFSNPQFGQALSEEIRFPEPAKTEKQIKEDTAILRKASFEPVEINLDLGSDIWNFKLYWVEKISDAPWVTIENPQDNHMDIFLNISHPFFAEYLERPEFLELIMQFVIALALSEKMARLSSTSGLIDPGIIRINMNRILKRVADIEMV
jgi:hypothetical protein